MLATALLHGLPPNFRDFKEKYDWIRSTKSDDAPDLDYLYERLHVEELKQIRLKEERKAKDRARKEASSYNSSGGTGYNGRPKQNHEDRSRLKCTYPKCGQTGHTEDRCWTKDPSKAPRSFKDRIAANTDNKPIDGMGGTTETNLTTFRDAYSYADGLGTAPSPALHANAADTSSQMRSAGTCRELQGSGGAGTGGAECRESSLAEGTLGAFLVGTSCTPDTWLADTGANMHIVNDTKWFKKDTFRPFNDCSIDISTADGSTTLEVKGGGVAQVILKSPDGFPVTVLTIRMELLKEPIVRFEKGPHLWYKKRPSLDKSQRSFRRKAQSSYESLASQRTSGLKLYNMLSGSRTEHQHVRYARRMRRLHTKP
jgi:hypothetical protein